MSRMPLTAFFDNLAQACAEGDYRSAAACFILPGGIYVGDRVIVLTGYDQVASLLADTCRHNRAQGAARARPRIFGQSISRRNNYSVWVSWDHVSAQGHSCFHSSIRYFCRDTAQGVPQIQLTEICEIPAGFSTQDVARLSARARALG